MLHQQQKAPSSLLAMLRPESPCGWEVPSGTKLRELLNWYGRSKPLIDDTCETQGGGCFRKPWGRASLAGILRSANNLRCGKDACQLKRWLGEMNLHHLAVQRIITNLLYSTRWTSCSPMHEKFLCQILQCDQVSICTLHFKRHLK